ncbi:MAG: 16S rRNA (cytosine(1402)-N(4))-methyltransferase RsmH [Acidobacteriota bacterium]
MEHVPVMVEETLKHLNPERGGIYLDCTVGLGGHSKKILEASSPDGKLIGIEKDEESLLIAKKNLENFGDRATLFRGDFRDVFNLNLNLSKIKGVLFDLGISSYQLSVSERGFSHTFNGPLDMRIDRNQKKTAYEIVNHYSEKDLKKIFEGFMERRWIYKVVREILKKRKEKRIESTEELRLIIEKVFHWKPKRGRTHPAQKVFLAIRNEVNGELDSLGKFFIDFFRALQEGCRIVIISFHSLEDRIVKNAFKELSSNYLSILTKKPVCPSKEEVIRNPRARSSKLRAAVRI